MKVRLKFAWYDIWVGAFWDGKSKILYVCPFPMCLIEIHTRGGRD